jgi:hypothetical protein
MMAKKVKKYVRIPSHTRKIGGKTVKIRAHIRKTTVSKKKKK